MITSDFVHLLWLFNSSRETREIIRLDLREAGLLYKYARLSYLTEGSILEIGRYWGGSTVLLAMATHNSDVNVVSVDVVTGCHDPDVDEWLNNYEEKILLPLWELVHLFDCKKSGKIFLL